MSGSNWTFLWATGEIVGLFLAIGVSVVLAILLAPRAAALWQRLFAWGRTPGTHARRRGSDGSNRRPHEAPRRAGWARRASDPNPAEPAIGSAERSDGYEGWLEEPPWRSENPGPQPYPF